MSQTKIRPGLRNIDIKSYVRDSWEILKEHGYKEEEVLNCSLGVNPYGCSPSTVEAAKKIDWDMICKYPNPSYREVKKYVLDYWSDITKFEKSEIFFGTGSITILDTLTKLLLDKDSKVLGYCPQFNEFENLAKIIGSHYEYMELKEEDNFKFSAEKFIELIDDSYDVIFIDNPNNPTGQIINLEDIEKIVKEARKYNIPVIIDEAYGDFIENSRSAIILAEIYSNIIVVRSFSKGLGMANIRLGYVVLNRDLSKYYEIVNIPPFVFPDILNNIVVETLKDRDFIINSRKKIMENKTTFMNSIDDEYIVSETDLGVPIVVLGTKKDVNLYEELLKVGVLTTAGDDFTNLNERFVRIRVPKNVDELIEKLNSR